ncbi:hypothetical protein Hanom_Chr03g00233701 [Helianthus anomalus]
MAATVEGMAVPRWCSIRSHEFTFDFCKNLFTFDSILRIQRLLFVFYFSRNRIFSFAIFEKKNG